MPKLKITINLQQKIKKTSDNKGISIEKSTTSGTRCVQLNGANTTSWNQTNAFA